MLVCKVWLVLWIGTLPDLSLWGNQYKPPGYPSLPYLPSYNPEGVLWFLLNPYNLLTPYGYELYTFAVDMGLLAVQLWLYKKGRLPFSVIGLNNMLGFEWYFGWGHEMQNITVTSIMPLMYLLPEIGLISFIQKFPIGWFPISMSEPHWACLAKCAIYTSTVDFTILEAFRSINYAIILVMFFHPLYRRWRDGKPWLPFLRFLKKR